MTGAELDRLEDLAAAASPGPWDVMANADWNVLCETGRRVVIASGNDLRDLGNPEDRNNAAFIAAARVAVPALVAEVRRLSSDLDRLAGDAMVARSLAIRDQLTTRAEAAEAELGKLRSRVHDLELCADHGHDEASGGAIRECVRCGAWL